VNNSTNDAQLHAQTTPIDSVLNTLRARGIEPKKTRKGWTCRCPAHTDRAPSLSLAIGTEGRALVRCFAGCPIDAIVSALGLTLSDLMPAPTPPRDHDADPTNAAAACGRFCRADESRAAPNVADRWRSDAGRIPPQRHANMGMDL
jgi:hypothetical protein